MSRAVVQKAESSQAYLHLRTYVARPIVGLWEGLLGCGSVEHAVACFLMVLGYGLVTQGKSYGLSNLVVLMLAVL